MTTSMPCKSRIYPAATIDQVASWRDAYEIDPAVSIKFVCETCGVSPAWFKSYMRRRGWSKNPAVKQAAKEFGGQIASAKRWGRPTPARPTPAPRVKPAFASVFTYAQAAGVTLSTGGRVTGLHAGDAA